MHYAALYDQKEIALFLNSKKAICDAKDKNGNTPLHIAASYGILSLILSDEKFYMIKTVFIELYLVQDTKSLKRLFTLLHKKLLKIMMDGMPCIFSSNTVNFMLL